jgi:hypothetical protein
MRCPGQDTQFWKPCPACKKPVEFFKDDVDRWCPHCKCKFRNPRLALGCAEWCPAAATCIGTEKTNALKDGSNHGK